MIHIVRTNVRNPDFAVLVKSLDVELAQRDGDEHPFYAQFNKLDSIKHVVLACEGDIPLGCGAIKAYAPGIMEIKRMYVAPEHRGKGIAGKILGELERWSLELGAHACILETGIQQPEAVALYRKCGYRQIENYGQYAGVENSLCFEKQIAVPGVSAAVEQEVIQLIESFCRSFDQKDWALMAECLAENLEVDYSSFRGVPKQNMRADAYIQHRVIGLEGLRTEHRTSGYAISQTGSDISCQCDFEILRYKIGSDKYFHSYGKYTFGMERVNAPLKIAKIRQVVDRSEGDKAIHGAFKKP